MACQYANRITEMGRNLRHIYRTQTTDSDRALGIPWYDDAHRIMREWSDTYGYSIATCAAVTAAISPQCDWPRNLIIADDILAMRPPSIGGAIGSNVTKAQLLRDARAYDTRTVFKSGPKVYSFSRNLAGDYSCATIDTHALQAALGDVEATVHLKQGPYDCFATAYERAAVSFEYEPAVFQAVIWHTWKRLYPRVVKLKRRTQWSAIGEF